MKQINAIDITFFIIFGLGNFIIIIGFLPHLKLCRKLLKGKWYKIILQIQVTDGIGSGDTVNSVTYWTKNLPNGRYEILKIEDYKK